jgi:hypothetical protein
MHESLKKLLESLSERDAEEIYLWLDGDENAADEMIDCILASHKSISVRNDAALAMLKNLKAGQRVYKSGSTSGNVGWFTDGMMVLPMSKAEYEKPDSYHFEKAAIIGVVYVPQDRVID